MTTLPSPADPVFSTERIPSADGHGAARTVVVVGASGVLGSHLAALLAELGPVALVVRDANRVPSHLAHLPTHVADVRDARAVSAALQACAGEDGALAGVVIASGVVAFGGFGELDGDVAQRLMDTNATGVLHVLDAAVPLLGKGGFVVNLSGVAAESALVGMGAYCASKAAASAAMRVAHRELRRRGARAIDVRVGHVETGLVGRALAGVALKLPVGLDAAMVAARIVDAIRSGEEDLGPGAFA